MGNNSQSERCYVSQANIWDKMHPVLIREDRTGSRVKRQITWSDGL
jgi:hypothetical protein